MGEVGEYAMMRSIAFAMLCLSHERGAADVRSLHAHGAGNACGARSLICSAKGLGYGMRLVETRGRRGLHLDSIGVGAADRKRTNKSRRRGRHNGRGSPQTDHFVAFLRRVSLIVDFSSQAVKRKSESSWAKSPRLGSICLSSTQIQPFINPVFHSNLESKGRKGG